jgi:pimeloyl-ACP methyl ester carboxylesterase
MDSSSSIAPLFYLDNHKNSQRILIFLHGNLLSSRYWEPLVNELEKLDDQLRLVRVDIRGFGRSQPALGWDSISSFALDIK